MSLDDRQAADYRNLASILHFVDCARQLLVDTRGCLGHRRWVVVSKRIVVVVVVMGAGCGHIRRCSVTARVRLLLQVLFHLTNSCRCG